MKKQNLFMRNGESNWTVGRVLRYIRTSAFISLFCSVNYTNAQELEILIREALTRNPEIQKYEIQHGISLEKVNEAGALPNTDFIFGVPISSPETRTGPQRLKVSAKQRIPWFGVVTARKNYAKTLAEAQYEEVAIAKRKLIASISKSYYTLYTLAAKQEVLKRHINLLKTYETLALNAIEVGKASAVDVLKLQIRQNELQQLKQVLEQEYITAQSQCNTFLNNPISNKITIKISLEIPLETQEVSNKDLALHPELVRYDKLFQSIEKSELLHQKELHPYIAFGVDYALVSEGPITNFNDNGKDILIPNLSLSFPIFNTKHTSRIRQNELKRKELDAQKEERKNVLETLLDQGINNRKIARISYETATKNIKQAKDAEAILLKNYETGTVDFNAILDIQELQLKFQLHQVQATASYYIQATIIDYLTQK